MCRKINSLTSTVPQGSDVRHKRGGAGRDSDSSQPVMISIRLDEELTHSIGSDV